MCLSKTLPACTFLQLSGMVSVVILLLRFLFTNSSKPGLPFLFSTYCVEVHRQIGPVVCLAASCTLFAIYTTSTAFCGFAASSRFSASRFSAFCGRVVSLRFCVLRSCGFGVFSTFCVLRFCGPSFLFAAVVCSCYVLCALRSCGLWSCGLGLAVLCVLRSL